MGFFLEGANNGEPIHGKNNHLLVDALSQGPLEHASELGDAASFHSAYSATGGQEVIYIKNDEPDRLLHLSRFFLFSDAASVWDLFEVTSATAASGTALVYRNPNLSKPANRSHTSFGSASVAGSLTGNRLFSFTTLADVESKPFLEGSLILGKDDAIAITLVTTGVMQATVLGFWALP